MSKLAINGGPKSIAQNLRQPWPIHDEREEQSVLEVLRSRKWGRSGFDYYNHGDSKLYAFEKAFAEFHNSKFGLAVSTGTTALETCLRVLGVEAGCEVIVPFAAPSTRATPSTTPKFTAPKPNAFTKPKPSTSRTQSS